MEEGERDLFERGIRAALDSHAGPGLDQVLRERGWYEALGTDPRTAIAVLFELEGELHTSSSVDGVMASVLLPDDPSQAVVLPAVGSADPPAKRQGDVVVVHGVGTERLRGATTAVVPTGAGGAIGMLTIPTTQLDLRPVGAMDPTLGLIEVTATMPVGADPREDGTDQWRDAVALGQRALGHQLVGTARRMLGLARDHATERVQFGRPIASFQAVRHRLADSLVAVETAEASLSAAWDLGSPFAASVAKAIAGRGTRAVAGHAQQILAGMGFTAEHPLHLFVKRTLVLDQLLGASSTITRSMGEQLLSSRKLPAALPL